MTTPNEPKTDSSKQTIVAKEGATIKEVIQTIIEGPVAGDVEIVLGDKVYTRSNLEELNDYLTQAVKTLEARMYQTLRPPAVPKHPYKSLYAFTLEDANIFFGREAASQELFEKVMANRLTVYHAKSGAGKTSLLQAGLSPNLIKAGYLPIHIYTHPYEEDLTPGVKRAIVPPRGPQPESLAALTLHEFLGEICTHLNDQTKGIVIIFDQFEEFLVSLPGPDIRAPFKKVLSECYEDQSLPVRFVISVREDVVEGLDEFRDYIPHILQNSYQLPPMTQVELKEAITRPLEQLQKKVRFQPALLDKLLIDLGGAEAELIHLQIVCTQLYDSLPAEEEELTLSLYNQLGGTEKILTTYLNDRLSELPSQKRLTARNVLRELVSSTAASRTLPRTALVEQVSPDQTLLEDVLDDLVEAGLLRREDVTEVEEYELAHTYLAKEIVTWVDQDELKVKEAQDLLRKEKVFHRVHKTLVDENRLNILRTNIKRLALDNEAQTLLFQSSLERGHDISFWLEQIEDKELAITQLSNRLKFVQPPGRRNDRLKELALTQLSNRLKNHALRKKLTNDLKSNLALSLREPLLLALQNVFDSARGTDKRNVARALWTLRAWLPKQDWLPILKVLALEWTLMGLGIGLVLVLLLNGSSALWKLFSRERAEPGHWVTVEEGEFIMGNDEVEAEFAHRLCREEKEQNKDDNGDCVEPKVLLKWQGRQADAWLPSFSIMDNEVTNAQYRQCVNAGVCQDPEGWDHTSDVNKPAANLNWTEAMTYCDWLGGRLPTEGEWEKAARGPGNNSFPWGNDWDPNRANIEHRDHEVSAKVIAFDESDKSGYGVKNMAGNVREWTASPDQYLPINGKFNNEVLTSADVGQNKPVSVIIRGGQWKNTRYYALVFTRGLENISERKPVIGFRCVCPNSDCQKPWTKWWIWFQKY